MFGAETEKRDLFPLARAGRVTWCPKSDQKVFFFADACRIGSFGVFPKIWVLILELAENKML